MEDFVDPAHAARLAARKAAKSEAAKKAAATRKANREETERKARIAAFNTRLARPLTFCRLAPKLLAGVSHAALVACNAGYTNPRHFWL